MLMKIGYVTEFDYKNLAGTLNCLVYTVSLCKSINGVNNYVNVIQYSFEATQLVFMSRFLRLCPSGP